MPADTINWEAFFPNIDTKNVAAAGTPEQLTVRLVKGTSIWLKPKGAANYSAPTGSVLLVDGENPATAAATKKIPIPADGVVLSLEEPRKLFIDVTVNGEGVHWAAL